MHDMQSTITRRTVLIGGLTMAGAAAMSGGARADTAAVAQTDLERIRAGMQGNQNVKWVFAGDSITHGALHVHGSRDYVQLFEERLRWELKQEANLVLRTATSGWRVKSLAEDLEWRVLQFAPQVVSLHFGMNDCSEGEAGLDDFRKRYADVIGKIRAACNAAIIVHTPNGIITALDTKRGPNLAAYAGAARDVANQCGCVLVDHFKAWEEYAQLSNPFYLMNDAIHPNEYGHRYKAHLLFKTLGIWEDVSAMCRLFVPR